MNPGQLIRVLGPIDVLTPTGPVSVGGVRARSLLGALVIGVGHAVPIDHLHEVIWGDDPPVSVDNTTQSYISHLRGILGTEAIVRFDHSYALAVGPADIDALLFERQLAEAVEARDDPEACRRLSREALRLWRGRAFGDLADDEPFRLEGYRLDELRLAAVELNLEAELALGRHELVVGELMVAVEEHPYREHLWHLLIRALASSDRRVEALRECARVRRILAEAGVQPGEKLVDLEHEILVTS